MQHPHVAAVANSLQPTAYNRVESLQLTANSTNSVGRTSVRSSDFLTRNRLSRPSRAKRHLAWEQIELQSGGYYADSLRKLAARFPELSLMELRVCALIKGMMKSWEIADRLAIDEKTVENHRIRIRKKLGLASSERLFTHLTVR